MGSYLLGLLRQRRLNRVPQAVLILFGFILVYLFYASFSHTSLSSHILRRAAEGDIQSGDAICQDDAVAQQLKREVRVLCWVMTMPANHMEKAIHVKATWGKRCNTLLFMSSANDTALGTVGLDVEEGRDYLWAKTKAAFTYIHKHHRDDADWFLKADDDTYTIVENLRYMLAAYNSSDPVYFGSRFKPYVKQGYMSGGAGYVLSKKALDLLVEDGLTDPSKCKAGHDGAEDVEIGKCLEHVGVRAGDSRDEFGQGRFFPFNPVSHIFPNEDTGFWYWSYIYYPIKPGLDCCSDTAVSFHYISPREMYTIEYLVYHVRPFGISHRAAPLRAALPPKPEPMVVEDVAKEEVIEKKEEVAEKKEEVAEKKVEVVEKEEVAEKKEEIAEKKEDVVEKKEVSEKKEEAVEKIEVADQENVTEEVKAIQREEEMRENVEVIADMKEEIKVKEEVIADVKEEIKEKNDEILQEELSQREEEIANMKEEIKEKERVIAELKKEFKKENITEKKEDATEKTS